VGRLGPDALGEQSARQNLVGRFEQQQNLIGRRWPGPNCSVALQLSGALCTVVHEGDPFLRKFCGSAGDGRSQVHQEHSTQQNVIC